jgi:hypothetical protein
MSNCMKCGEGPGFDSEADDGMTWVNFVDEFKTGSLCSSCNYDWSSFILNDETYLELQILNKEFDVFCTIGVMPFVLKEADQQKELRRRQIRYNLLTLKLIEKVEDWLK